MAINFLGKIRDIRSDYGNEERRTLTDIEACIKELMILVGYLKQLEKIEFQIKQEMDTMGLRLWYKHRPTEYAELLKLRQRIVNNLNPVNAAIIKINDDLLREEKTISTEQQHTLKRLS
jgi:hypothetical protein